MAKILFVQDRIFESTAIQCLSSMLKKYGHECDLIVVEDLKNNNQDVLYEIKNFGPDTIAFSIHFFGYEWALKLAKDVKDKLNIPNIFGGPYPTSNPNFIENEEVDAICIGEAEEAIVDYANALDNNMKDIEKIKNIHIKKNGKTYKNPLRPLKDINTLPYPDRALYHDKFSRLRESPNMNVSVSRGCSYNCSFCLSPQYRRLYKGKGDYVQRRSERQIIQELKDLKQKYKIKTFYLYTEDFTTDKSWISYLLDLYKKEIGLPFVIMARFNELNERVVKKLKDARCYYVSLGLESANERIRNNILNKGLSNEQIINGAKLLKKYKIGMLTHSILGSPGETIEDAFETLKFAAEIKSDIALATFLLPIKGSPIYDYIEKNDLFISDINLKEYENFWSGVVVNIKDKNEVEILQNLFQLGVWFPSLIPFMRVLVKLPQNVLFKSFFRFSQTVKYKKTRNLKWSEIYKPWSFISNLSLRIQRALYKTGSIVFK